MRTILITLGFIGLYTALEFLASLIPAWAGYIFAGAVFGALGYAIAVVVRNASR